MDIKTHALLNNWRLKCVINFIFSKKTNKKLNGFQDNRSEKIDRFLGKPLG
jgi:hypothetical protein